jgi:hypothetical protein
MANLEDSQSESHRSRGSQASANISARDITEAKRKARDEHIGEHGRAKANHIFVHVPEVLGVDGWQHFETAEQEFDYEHVWRNDDGSQVVAMQRSNYQWEVTYKTHKTTEREHFDFSARKHAEARLVELMEEN